MFPLVVEGTFEGYLNAFGVAYFRLMFEAADRRQWIETLRQRYGLVTIDGGMPREPCGMTTDGNYEGWYMAQRGDGLHDPAEWRRR